MIDEFEQRWLHGLPPEWNEKRADFLCNPYRVTINPEVLGDELVAHYSIPQVQESGGPLVEAASDIDSSKLLVETPTLLVSKLNPRKKTICIAKPHPEHPTLASGEFVAINSDQMDRRYAYYLWSSEYVTDRLSAIVQSATRSHQRVNPADILKLPWKWPPLETQCRIAQFLDEKTAQIDGLIEKKRALLSRLAEKRQALITRAVTKGLNPDTPMKPSGIDWLGDIPAHWDIFLVKRHFRVTYGVGGEINRSLEDGTNLLSLPNITKDGRFKLDDVPYTQAATGDLLLRKGDLLFNWRNGSTDHLGKTVRFDMDGSWTHVSFLLRLRSKSSDIHSGFLRYFLNGLRETEFFAYAKAGVNNTFNLFELENLPVISPPTGDEQEKIANRLDEQISSIDIIADRVQDSITMLEEYRTAVVTCAVTGQIGGLH